MLSSNTLLESFLIRLLSDYMIAMLYDMYKLPFNVAY